MTFVLTGLDIEDKAALGGAANCSASSAAASSSPTSTSAAALRPARRADATSRPPRTCASRSRTPTRARSAAASPTRPWSWPSAGYAGFHTTTPPAPESAYGVYWPALVPADGGAHTRWCCPDGTTVPIAPTAPADTAPEDAAPAAPSRRSPTASLPPLGRPPLAGGRRSAGPDLRRPLRRQGRQRQRRDLDPRPAAYAWLRDYLTVDRRPGAAARVRRRSTCAATSCPTCSALNFVIVGLLGEGVAASTRPDPQAKGLGEYLRSRTAEIPAALLDRGGP